MGQLALGWLASEGPHQMLPLVGDPTKNEKKTPTSRGIASEGKKELQPPREGPETGWSFVDDAFSLVGGRIQPEIPKGATPGAEDNARAAFVRARQRNANALPNVKDGRR